MWKEQIVTIKWATIPHRKIEEIDYPKLVEHSDTKSVYLLLDANKAVMLAKKTRFEKSEGSIVDFDFTYIDFEGALVLSNSGF